MEQLKISDKTSLFILPPVDICDQIQEFREQFDNFFSCRILPHITIFHPFIESKYFNEFKKNITKLLLIKFHQNKFNFTIELKEFEYFDFVDYCIVYIKITNPLVCFIQENILNFFPQLAPKKKFVPHLTIGRVEKKDINDVLNYLKNNFNPVVFSFKGLYFINSESEVVGNLYTNPTIQDYLSLINEEPDYIINYKSEFKKDRIPIKKKPEGFNIYTLIIDKEAWKSKKVEYELNNSGPFDKIDPKKKNPNYKFSHKLFYIYKKFIIDIYQNEIEKIDFKNFYVSNEQIQKYAKFYRNSEEIKKLFAINQFVESKLLELCKAENFFYLYREDNTFFQSLLYYFIQIYKEYQFKIDINVLCGKMIKTDIVPAGLDLYKNPLNIPKKKLELDEIFKNFDNINNGTSSIFLSLNKSRNTKLYRNIFVINLVEDLELLKNYPNVYNTINQIIKFISEKYENLHLHTWTILKYPNEYSRRRPHFDTFEGIKQQVFILNLEVSSFIDFYPVFDEHFKDPIRITLKHGDLISFYQYSISLWAHGIPQGYPFMIERYALMLRYFEF